MNNRKRIGIGTAIVLVGFFAYFVWGYEVVEQDKCLDKGCSWSHWGKKCECNELQVPPSPVEAEIFTPATFDTSNLQEVTGIWVGVLWPTGFLLPIGRIDGGKWDECWPKPGETKNHIPTYKPPRNWLINGNGTKLVANGVKEFEMEKVEMSCGDLAWGIQTSAIIKDKIRIALSGPGTDLLDRSKKNWNQEKVEGDENTYHMVELIGRFRLGDGILSIKHHQYYEATEFEIEWAPRNGTKVAVKYPAGGC